MALSMYLSTGDEAEAETPQADPGISTDAVRYEKALMEFQKQEAAEWRRVVDNPALGHQERVDALGRFYRENRSKVENINRLAALADAADPVFEDPSRTGGVPSDPVCALAKRLRAACLSGACDRIHLLDGDIAELIRLRDEADRQSMEAAVAFAISRRSVADLSLAETAQIEDYHRANVRRYLEYRSARNSYHGK